VTSANDIFVKSADAFFQGKRWDLCQKGSQEFFWDGLLIDSFSAGMKDVKYAGSQIIDIIRIYNPYIGWGVCQYGRMGANVNTAGLKRRAEVVAPYI